MERRTFQSSEHMKTNMTGDVSLIAPIFQVQTFQNCQNFDCHLLKGEKFKLKA